MTVLDLQYNFATLSLRDLLEARDAYHYHLLSRPNVVGTAVGYYLIRKDEPWPTRRGEGKTPKRKPKSARTLGNSEVRDYSWPCVLAFVRRWEAEESFSAEGRYDPTDILPKTLYLPDGRAVPVCVVQVDPATAATDALPPPAAPQAGLGGGLAIEVEAQGQVHMATAGCLLSDGHTTYVLTARHACGEPGEVVSVRLRGGPERIGVSTSRQLTRLPFGEVYPDFVGRRSYTTLDVGLVRLDDVGEWTSATYGLPPPGPMADVHERNLSLKLIDQPVVGRGAASGLLSGRVKALFYRYRSVGGYDYIGDFLIAPDGERQTRPGDSGMVWHLDVTVTDPDGPRPPLASLDLRPLAVEWGGQVFDVDGCRSAFAVATSLSNVCKLLDVELVTDVGRGVSGYWGRTGHYSIGMFAIGLVGAGKLEDLLSRNAGVLSFDRAAIETAGFDDAVGQASMRDEFVPLADVPDEIWKKVPRAQSATYGRTGGRDYGSPQRSNGPEHPQHYADIDAPYLNGKTLRALCASKPGQYLTVAAWQTFYDKMAAQAQAAGDSKAAAKWGGKLKQGLVPFRIWQFYDAMVGFLQAGDVLGFVTAGGIAAHYLGDCSQPLHGSILADGDESRPGPRRDADGNLLPYGKDVHSAYETAMISRKADDGLLSGVAAKLAPLGGHHGLPLRTSGFDMAKAVIELMEATAATLPPQRILDSFENAGGAKRVAVYDAMWGELGDDTIQVMTLGARYLALLWESAWVAGGGPALADSKLKAFDPADVRDRYIDPEFLPSLVLDEIGAVLQ